MNKIKNIKEPFQIGQNTLANRLILAPMAGATGRVFRNLCAEFGAALAVTELCSAKGIVHDSDFKRNKRYLDIENTLLPTAIQLFSSSAEDLEVAIPRVLEHPVYSNCTHIDLNCGCPVEKVTRTGAGSALMKTPELAAALVRAAVKAAAPYGKAITVKFRLGWDDEHINCVDFARRMEDAGAAMLCLHARTREALYSGQAQWEYFAPTAAALTVPLIANGDIRTRQDAETLLKVPGVEALMIGRAALGCPWIFAEILENGLVPGELEKADIICRHLDGLIEDLGEWTGVREFRPQLAAYLKGRPGAAALRREMMELTQPEEIKERLHKFFLSTQ